MWAEQLRPRCSCSRSLAVLQAAKAGRFADTSGGNPGVGKYTPSYTILDRRLPGWDITCSHSSYSGGYHQLGLEAEQAAGPALGEAVDETGPSQANLAGGDELGDDCSGGAVLTGPGTTLSKQAAALHIRTAKVFKDAHRVHAPRAASAPRPPPVRRSARSALLASMKEPEFLEPRSACFKAVPRLPPEKGLMRPSAGSHLGPDYFSPNYDRLTRKNLHLPTARFEAQAGKVPVLVWRTQTGALVGPGSYHQHSLPTSRTGAHVSAGHDKMRMVHDFGKDTARPETAPLPPGTTQAQRRASSAAGRASGELPTNLLWMWGDAGKPLTRGLATLGALSEEARQMAKMRASSSALDVSAASTAAASKVGLDPQQLERYGSAGFAKRTPSVSDFGRQSSRSVSAKGLRALSRADIIPPAAVQVRNTLGELNYEPDPDVVKPRSLSFTLPPNRTAISQTWAAHAAMAY